MLKPEHLPAALSSPVQPATPMEMLNRALMSGAAPETLEKMLATAGALGDERGAQGLRQGDRQGQGQHAGDPQEPRR